MSKYFVFGGKKELPKEAINQIRVESETLLKTGDELLNEKAQAQLHEPDNLLHVEGRVIVKVDMKNKNSWAFSDGTTIRLEREYNNFNRRYTQPVNCIVISGEGLPKDAELLVDHNAFHETNRINDYKNSFEIDGSDRIRYFAVPDYECYAWRISPSEKWNPCYPFEFALRVFKPYKGLLEGIEPTVLKDTLYCTSGRLEGLVLKTLKACDYQIVYQQANGREGYLICFRPFGEPKRNMDEEAIAILHDETEAVDKGELLLGYEIKDAKTLNQLSNG